MKSINFYAHISAQQHTAFRTWRSRSFMLLGATGTILACITGYLFLDLHKKRNAHAALHKKMNPLLERNALQERLQIQLDQQIHKNNTFCTANPCQLITTIKSLGAYIHTCSVRQKQATIHIYCPATSSIQTLVSRLEKEAHVKKVTLQTLKQHTKEQRLIVLSVEFA